MTKWLTKYKQSGHFELHYWWFGKKIVCLLLPWERRKRLQYICSFSVLASKMRPWLCLTCIDEQSSEGSAHTVWICLALPSSGGNEIYKLLFNFYMSCYDWQRAMTLIIKRLHPLDSFNIYESRIRVNRHPTNTRCKLW